MSTADAILRETAWLQVSGDGLPSLPYGAGGPFQILQGYWPRTPATNKTGLYVLRAELLAPRVAAQRIRSRYEMTLRVVWPVIATGTPLLETAQQDLDNAIGLLFRRIQGPLGDKSHGGRFLSAGENPRRVRAPFEDPEQSMARYKALRATVAYGIDDFEVSG